MRLRLTLSILATLAAVNCSPDKKEREKKSSSGDSNAARPSKASQVAHALRVRGFFLEEVTQPSTDVDSTQPADNAIPAVGTIEQEMVDDPALQKTRTPEAGAVPPDLAPEGPIPGAPDSSVADGGLYPKGRISKFQITLLSRNNEPITGATLSLRKMKFNGKDGYSQIDSFKIKGRHSNKFVVYIAAGRSYSLAALAKGYQSQVKDINFDGSKSVDVEFPVLLDKADGDDPNGDDPTMNDKDMTGILPGDIPPPPPARDSGPGMWDWCLRNPPQPGVTIAHTSGSAASSSGLRLDDAIAQEDAQTQARAEALSQMVQNLGADPQYQDAFRTMQDMRGRGYRVKMLGCQPDVVNMHWVNDKGDKVRQRIPQDQLKRRYPRGMGRSSGGGGALIIPVGGSVPVAVGSASATEPVPVSAAGLIGCTDDPDMLDLYDVFKGAGLNDVIVRLKAHVKAGGRLTSCTSAKPNVTLKFSDGTIIDFDGSGISGDFWL